MDNTKEFSQMEEIENLSVEQEESEYNDIVFEVPNVKAAQVTQSFNLDGTIKKLIKARKSTFVHTLLHLNGKKFDFEGRGYLIPIYDIRQRQMLLKTGRQVEKCCCIVSKITIHDGSEIQVNLLKVGDRIIGMDESGKQIIDTVVASESNGIKQCVRITTKLGSKLEVTYNHPFRKLLKWEEASNLIIGDKLASFRKGAGNLIPEDIFLVTESDRQEIIEKTLNSDIIWDEIVSIEDIGMQETWALQTASETYISDFIVSHNTTYLANNLAVNAVINPYNKALYVSPSHTQTRQFSNEKLKPAIEGSPLIRKYFQDSSVSTQVFEKGFTNGSYIFLRSAFRTADRTRGISSTDLCLDEIQDMIGSEIPVIMECTSHFPDSTVLMAGTPKSLDNPIERYWQETTMNEWMVPCFNHSPIYWNFLDHDNIGPTDFYMKGQLPPGPICKKCQKPLDVKKGRWTTFQLGKVINGYRIPQLMVPWIITTFDQWLKLLWKRDNYPFGQFANEVLGISYDNASKPITQQDIVECCSNQFKMASDQFTIEQAAQYQRINLTAGVDWGEGNDGSEKSPNGKIRNASYTVLTVGYYTNQRIFRVLFAKRYTGAQVDPDYCVKDIARICRAWGVKLCAVDWGHGWGVNNHLVRLLGAQTVVQIQYLPKQKERLKWDPIGFKYQVQRNLYISELFLAIKSKYIEFSSWEEIRPFAKDILSVFVEYVEYQRQMKYDHRASDPDDALHSLLYCRLASDIYLGKRTRD